MPNRNGLPAATGTRRLGWADLPAEVRNGVANVVGAPVASAQAPPGGFSHGVASRVRCTDGRSAFVKAANSRLSPAEVAFHQREAAVSGRLPHSPAIPRLLGSFDQCDWTALVFEDIDGRLPAQPWRHDELRRVLDALTALAGALTPTPIVTDEQIAPRLGGWLQIADAAAALARLEVVAPDAAAALDRLVALEIHLAEAIAGQTLLHGDVYPFNLLLTDDRVVFVDWPHAWVGADGCDVLTLLTSLPMSGMDPDPVVHEHPLTARLDPVHVNAFLAAHCGFLFHRICLSGPSVDPAMVAMMTALGRASFDWLTRRW